MAYANIKKCDSKINKGILYMDKFIKQTEYKQLINLFPILIINKVIFYCIILLIMSLRLPCYASILYASYESKPIIDCNYKRFGSIFKNDFDINSICLRQVENPLVQKIDTIILVKDNDTFTQVIQSKFSYDNGYLSERDFNIIILKSFDKNYHITHQYNNVTKFVYSNDYKNCIVNDYLSFNGLKNDEEKYLLFLNESAFIDSGVIYSNVVTKHSLALDSNPIYDSNNIYIRKVYYSLPAFNFIAGMKFYGFRNTKSYAIFNSPYYAEFVFENSGFPILSNTILKYDDFYLPIHQDSNFKIIDNKILSEYVKLNKSSNSPPISMVAKVNRNTRKFEGVFIGTLERRKDMNSRVVALAYHNNQQKSNEKNECLIELYSKGIPERSNNFKEELEKLHSILYPDLIPFFNSSRKTYPSIRTGWGFEYSIISFNKIGQLISSIDYYTELEFREKEPYRVLELKYDNEFILEIYHKEKINSDEILIRKVSFSYK